MENGYYLPDNYVYKRWNYFYNPMINARLNDLGAGATGADKGYGFANKNLNIFVAGFKYTTKSIQKLKVKVYPSIGIS